MYNFFHVLLKNKGRGEAVDVSLDSVKIEEVSWDDDSKLYIASNMPLSMGDILVDEKQMSSSIFLIICF